MTSVSKLRSPFVLTLSSTLSVAAVAACGSQVTTFESTSSGNGGGTSSSSSDNGTTSGTGASTSGSGVTTGGGNIPDDCPPDPPSGYEMCSLADPDSVCAYTLDCQSGFVELRFTCDPDSGQWTVVDQACDFEYDSCPGTELHCDGSWSMPQFTNPPSPCPDPRPKEFSACFAGKMGGVHEHCGYPCGEDAKSGWTIATCAEESWEYDGACAP